MCFNDYCTILQLDFDSIIQDSVVREKNIWVLRDSSEIIVFPRENLNDYKKYPFTSTTNTTPKMFVDEDGERCILLYPRGSPLYFTLSNPTFRTLAIPRNVSGISGCFIKRPKQLPAFLIGTSKGEIILITPGSNQHAMYVYKSQTNSPITEIVTVSNPCRIIFLLTDDRLLCFSGHDDLLTIFARGPGKHILFLGPGVKGAKKRVVSDPNGVSVLMEYGALLITAYEIGSEINFQQDVFDFDTHTVLAFGHCRYGMLFGDSTGVPVVSDGRVWATAPLPDVLDICCDSTEMVFVTHGDVIVFTVKDFGRFLCSVSLDRGDLKFVVDTIGNDKAALEELLVKVTPSRGCELSRLLRWPLKDAFETLSFNPQFLLSYMIGLLERVHPTRKRALMGIAIYALELLCQLLPDSEQLFIEFIEKNWKLIGSERLYKRMEEANFDVGCIKLAELENNVNQKYEFLFKVKDYDAIRNLLRRERSPEKYIEMISRIPDQTEREKFILEGNAFSANKITPILATMPSIAHKIVGMYPDGSTTALLLMVGLCKDNDKKQLRKLTQNLSISPTVLIRVSEFFGRYETVGLLLLRLKLSNLAIDFLRIRKGVDSAMSFISEIPSKESKRSAWLSLLKTVAPEKRQLVVSKIVSSDLFEFEELLDFVGDSEKMFRYTSRIKTAIDRMRVGEDIHEYRRHHRERTPEDFSVKLTDGCDLCGAPVLGVCFVRFPCGHEFHERCLSKRCDEIRENLGFMMTDLAEERDDLDSCPICGFLGAASIRMPF